MECALEGVRVLDFSWVITGPLATKLLANLGATVVKVENPRNVDLNRKYPPFSGGVQGTNRSGTFSKYNDGKYGITLDLKHPRARHFVAKLVRWSDVVLENFTPGTMERLGLSYNDLKRIKSDIIMVRASLMGQNGPYARQPGFGTMLQAYAGFTSSMRWPGRMPAGTSVPWTDYSGAGFTAIAILAALDYRKKNQKGVYIDLSQLEAAQQLLIPDFLDCSVNKRNPEPMGNRHPTSCPHGVYPCKGNDRWCVIAVSSAEEWRSLKNAMGNPDWTEEERFSSFKNRKKNEDDLDKLISLWTRKRKNTDIMQMLQRAGVPAGIVATGEDLSIDPQLVHRKHFKKIKHPEMGIISYNAPPFRLSVTPHRADMPAPCMGQHTEFVCRDLLGMSEDEFEELHSQGVFLQAGAVP
jgi:benzylsuccinate CoA-transferase BbsF subunit